jgi:hypothetical protein
MISFEVQSKLAGEIEIYPFLFDILYVGLQIFPNSRYDTKITLLH